MKKETVEWLKKANEDFKTSQVTFKNRRYDAAAFFCQQAIEKAMKALEIENFSSFDKTHDMYFLGKKIGLPEDLLKICEEISEYYVQTRYPDTYAKFNKKEISEALNSAKKVMVWIKKTLSNS